MKSPQLPAVTNAPKHEMIVRPEHSADNQPKWYQKVPKSAWLILLLLLIGFGIYYFSPREDGGSNNETAEQRELRQLRAERDEARKAPAPAAPAAPVVAPSLGLAPQGAEPEVEVLPAQRPQMAPAAVLHQRGGAVVSSVKAITTPDGGQWLLLFGPNGAAVSYPAEANRSADSISANMTWNNGQKPSSGRLMHFDTVKGQNGKMMNIYAWKTR